MMARETWALATVASTEKGEAFAKGKLELCV
jgi:hypothetical protein